MVHKPTLGTTNVVDLSQVAAPSLDKHTAMGIRTSKLRSAPFGTWKSEISADAAAEQVGLFVRGVVGI